MDQVVSQLNDIWVEKILVGNKFCKRKRSSSRVVTTEYQQRLKREAAKVLYSWMNNGVPDEIFSKLENNDLPIYNKI